MLPFEVEARTARAARATSTAVDAAALSRKVRAELPRWVARLVNEARAGVASMSLVQGVASDRQHLSAALRWIQRRPTELTRILEQALLRSIDERPVGSGLRGPQDTAAPLADAPALQLMDEAVIDQSIELACIVHDAEMEAKAEMQELAAACSGLFGLTAVDPRCQPLPAAAFARGLREGVMTLELAPAARSLLLRHLGSALGRELRRSGAELSAWLVAQGVQPARYAPCETPSGPDASAAAVRIGPPTEPSPPAAGAAAEALRRMVERAQRLVTSGPVTAAAFELDGVAHEAPSQHGALSLSFNALHAQVQPVQPLGPRLEPIAAQRLMDHLLDEVERQFGAKATTKAMLDALREPGRRLAAAEARLWERSDHPWWDLLNQALDAVSGHPELGTASAQSLLQAFNQALLGVPGPAACEAAAEAVRAETERSRAAAGDALAVQAAELLEQLDAEETALQLRNRLVQQLRATPAAPALRQFLLGLWAETMAHTARRHGLGSEQLARHVRTADDLLRASARVGVAAPPRQRAMLLKEVRAALTLAGTAKPLAERWLGELESTLADPPSPVEEGFEEPQDKRPTPRVIGVHAGVPAGTQVTGADSTLAEGRNGRWLDTPNTGTDCRLFLLGRWMTLQLSWASPRGNLFLFTSRHDGGLHSLTGRMLGKLRAAGLATSFEDKFLLAQAMDSVMRVEAAMLPD